MSYVEKTKISNDGGTTINPATEEKQDTMIAALGGGSELLWYDTDSITSTLMYVGSAAVGSSGASAVWKIFRFDSANKKILYAGTGTANQIWDNRQALSYS